MPDRIIHEDACKSPTLDMLTDGAERLFWRLTTQADDQGRFDADARTLLASCFPLRIGRLKAGRVEAWRDELAQRGLICLYRVHERLYGLFSTWEKWQRKRDSRPKRPGPDAEGVEIVICGDLPQLAANCGDLPQLAARARVLREAGGGSRESLTTERRESGASPQIAADSPPPPPSVIFTIPDSIQHALHRVPRLGTAAQIRTPQFWQAQVRANPGVDFAGELLKAEAYLTAHPEKHYKRLPAFLNSWLGRADRPTP